MARKSIVFSLVLVGGNFVAVGQGQEATLGRPLGDAPRTEVVQPEDANQLRWTSPTPAIRQVAHETPILVAQADGSIRSVPRAERSSTRRGATANMPANAVANDSGNAPTNGDNLPSVLKRKVKPAIERSTVEANSNLTPADSSPELTVESEPTLQPAPAEPKLTSPRASMGDSISVARKGTGERAPSGGGASASLTPHGISKGKQVALRSAGPMLAVEATGPRAVVVGKQAPYTVTVVNSSQIPASNVQVRVHVPMGVETVAMRTVAGEVARLDEGEQAGTVLWSIPEVAGGARVELAMQLIPRDGQSFELGVDWSCQPRAAVASIAVQQPQLDLSISGPKEARFGETVTLLVTVANPGTGDAEEVQVKLQAGQNTPENIPIGLVPAGQQKQIEVQLAANQAGTSQITIEATGEGDLKASTSTELVVKRAELEVAVTAPQQTFTGTPTAFQIRVTNTGTAAAEETTLIVSLPAGAKLEASTEGSRASSNGVSWRVGTLPPGMERVFEVQCDLTASGENKLDARVAAATGLNANGSAVTEVQALADLKLVVDDPKGPRSVGEEVVYELHVTNRGTKAAEDVHVVVQFSEGVEPIAAEGGAAELADGQVVFEPIGRLASGQRAVLKVKARADRAGSHRFRAQVTCDNSETQLVSEGTSRFFAGNAATAKSGEPAAPARTASRPTTGKSR